MVLCGCHSRTRCQAGSFCMPFMQFCMPFIQGVPSSPDALRRGRTRLLIHGRAQSPASGRSSRLSHTSSRGWHAQIRMICVPRSTRQALLSAAPSRRSIGAGNQGRSRCVIDACSRWGKLIAMDLCSQYAEMSYGPGVPVRPACASRVPVAHGPALALPGGSSRFRNHAPLRDATVGTKIGCAGLRVAGGWGSWCWGWWRAGWKVHSCAVVLPVVAVPTWTVRGRVSDWRWSPLAGNPRCCCVRVCQSPVLIRGPGRRCVFPVR